MAARSVLSPRRTLDGRRVVAARAKCRFAPPALADRAAPILDGPRAHKYECVMRALLAACMSISLLASCSSGTAAPVEPGDDAATGDALVDGAGAEVASDGGASGDGSTDASAPDAAPDAKPDAKPDVASDTADAGGKTIAFCSIACVTNADCATAGVPIYAADHYTCDAGACAWKGCASDQECSDTFHDPQYACRDLPGAVKSCQKTCTKPADCVVASPVYSADNWSCVSSTCRWDGCIDDAECKSAFGGSYVCRESTDALGVPIAGPKNCFASCTAASDCSSASPAYDADNYACRSSVCRYTGCKSDAECTDAFKKPYVCR